MPIYNKKSMTTTKIYKTPSKMTMVNIYETCDIFLKDYSKKKVLHVLKDLFRLYLLY